MHAMQQSLLSASASTTTLSLSHSRSGDSPAAALTQGNADRESVLERIGSESSLSDACGKGKEPVLDCVGDSDERAADGSEDCEGLVLLRTPRAHGVDGGRDGDASEVCKDMSSISTPEHCCACSN
jgi:hypothetical protein